MKTKKNLVMSMFRNILAAGLIAVSFIACSDELDAPSFSDNNVIPEGANTAILEAYGLTYQTFDNTDDVMIVDEDTTLISISKAYAEKLGIESFVGHPMGVWQKQSQLPYIRVATSEKLEGNRYLVSVRPAAVSEIIGNKKVSLSTEIYVNPNADGSEVTRADGLLMPGYAAKYMDDNNVIHPAVIHMTDPYGYEKPYHTKDDQPVAQTRADGEYQYMTADELTQNTRASIRNRIFSLNTKLDKDFQWAIEEGSEDSIYLGLESNVKFALNYFITLDGGVKWNAIIPSPYVKKFEAGLDGEFGFDAEIQFGISKEWELDPDKWKETLFTFSGYTFTFMVGPVPVAIKAGPELFAKIDGKVTGKAFMGFKYEYANNFKGGITYEDGKGWGLIKEFNEEKNSLTFLPPQFEIHAEAGVGLYLGAKIMIYGVAGPELSVGPRLGAEANLKISPLEEKLDLDAKVELTVNAVVGAKLELLGYEIAGIEETIELAGPWTLWQYPSDGTEHQVDPWISPAWKKLFEAAKTDKYGNAFTNNLQECINLLKVMNNIDDEAATKQIYLELMKDWDSCPEMNKWVFIELISNLGKYKDDLTKQYNDYQYQKHAQDGDTQWCNDYNWKEICEELKANKISGSKHAWFDSVSNEIHQWFLKEFNREPTLADGKDLDWLLGHIANFDYYKNLYYMSSRENDKTDDNTKKDTKEEVGPNTDELWQAIRTKIESEFPNSFTGRSPRGPKMLNSIRRSFKNKYGHEPGIEQGDYEIVREDFKRRMGL